MGISNCTKLTVDLPDNSKNQTQAWILAKNRLITTGFRKIDEQPGRLVLNARADLMKYAHTC